MIDLILFKNMAINVKLYLFVYFYIRKYFITITEMLKM